MLLALIFSVIIGLANCQKSPRSIETSYSEDKEYLYDYESQVLSGIPEGATTVAGLKLKSTVKMQVFSQSMVKLQLDSPRLYKINDVVDSKDPLRETVPSDNMDELLDEDAEKMKVHLCKPITLTYLRGHVRDLKTQEDDPVWSVNVKRGIISLLEINFNERQTLDKDVPVLMSNSEPKIYRVIEPSTAGECLTRYRVKPERSEDDVPSIDILKIRDYNRCTEKVIHTVDMLNGRPCHTCENKTKDHISAQSSVRYKLLGSPDQYIIASARSESHYDFVPYNEESGKLTTVSKQALILVRNGPIHDQIKDLRSPVEHQRPLKVKTSEDPSRPTSSEKLELKKEERESLLQMIEKLVTGFEKLTTDTVDEESGELVLELTRLLRKLDSLSLNKLFDEVLSKRSTKARKVILDILPILGTYASVDVVLDRLEKSDISKDDAPSALIALSMIPQADAPIVKRLMDFIKTKDIDSKIKEDSIRRSAWLALGSLGHKMMKSSRSLSKEIEDEHKALQDIRIESNDRDIRRKLDGRMESLKNKGTQTSEEFTAEKQRIVEVVKQLHSKEDKDSKILSIKVMGSLGYEEFLPLLETVLRDESSSEILKTETVQSLKHVLKNNPKQIEQILIPICVDDSVPDVVRMVAIDVVLRTDKSESTMEMIIRLLQDKPNDNILQYVKSMLTELSNQPEICDDMNSLSKNSSFARRFASKIPSDGYPKSRVYIRSDYSERMRMGHSYRHDIIFSPEETTPSLVKMTSSIMFLGKVSEVFEMKYTGKGMDSVLDKLLEDSTGTSLDSPLKTILHPRNRRSFGQETEQMIKEMKDKIGVESIVPKEVDGLVSFHLFGHEVIYADTDSLRKFMEPSQGGPQYGASMMENLQSKLSILDYVKKLMNFQTTVVRPLLHSSVITETGLPLTLKIETFSLMKNKGDLNIQPDLDKSSRRSPMSGVDTLVTLRPSGLLYIGCKMEVDMEHIRSGISVGSTEHVDTPITVSINVDPAKSKLFLKFRDEKKMRPMKLEMFSHATIQRVPMSVDKYPQAPEKKDISLIDGSEIKLIRFEYGKDVLGRNMRVVSERSVRKDNSVPLHPFAGKWLFYVLYEPTSPDGEVEVQVQHVSATDESSEDSDSSWYSKLTGWFSSPPKESSSEKSGRDSSSSSSDSDERDDSDKEFIDLRQKDLSMTYLKEKFSKHTNLMTSGVKCGLVWHLVDPKREKDHEIQVSTLYQKSPSKLQTSYTVELKMRTQPQDRKVWKMVTDMKLDLPRRDIEPSDLLDSQYQRSIIDDLTLTVRQNGKSVDSLIDLGSSLLTEAVRKSKEFESRPKYEETLEEIVNYILEKSSDADSDRIEDVLQKLRKSVKEAKELRKSSDSVSKVEEKLESVKKLIEKSKEISTEVNQKLDETSKGKQEPEDAVLVLYISKKQENLHRELKKTVKKILPLLSLSDRKDIEIKLEDLERKHKETKDKQMQHSEKKQPSELEKAKLEVAPADRDLYTTLQVAEKKLIDALVSKGNQIDDEKSQRQIDDKVRSYEDVVRDLKDLKKKLDEKLSEKGGLERALRVKVLEVMLYQKLAVLDLEKDIRDIEKKSQVSKLESLKTLSDDMTENSKKLLVEKKEELQRKCEELSQRLVLVIESKQDFSMKLPHDEEQLRKLFKVKLDQITVQESLKKKRQDEDSKEDHELIKEIVEKSKDISQSIKEILMPNPEDVDRSKAQLTQPIAVASLKAIFKQIVILDKVKRKIDNSILKKSVTEDPILEQCQKLRLETESMKADLVTGLRQQQTVLKALKEGSIPGYRLTSSRDDSPRRSSLITDIRKEIHNVEVTQAELKGLEKELKDKLNSQVIKQKKIVYAVIDKLQSSQEQLEKIHEALRQLQDHPDKERLEDVLKDVLDKVESQLRLVQRVEREVTDKTMVDESLFIPLQDVQRIKDSALKLKHSTKVLQTDVKSRSKRSTYEDSSSSEDSRRFRDLRGDKRDMNGQLKIQYGDVDESEPKVLSIRIFAKKSLEQLLWELDQSSPQKQSKLVQSYLSDRREPDDPTATGYRKIKYRLNRLRHSEILVAFEDSLPKELRKVMWELREGTKLMYVDRVEFSMPDKSNTKNKVEIITELKTDDRWTDITIKSPTETAKIRNIRTPALLRRSAFIYDSPAVAYHSTMYDSLPLASCEVTPDRVKTLKDRSIVVDLQSQPCSTVLTMDCSSQDTLAVTSKPDSQDPEKKVITILTKERKVELIPESSKVVVKVDGQIVPKPQDKDFVKVPGESKKHSVLIQYQGDRADVKIPSADLTVKSDGRKISIEVPKSYRNKLCGVCGNSEKPGGQELRGPKQVKYSDPQAYVTTYMVPESTCDPRPTLNRLGVSEIRRKSKQVPPKEETLVKEKTIDNIKKTCFSIKPVKKCPSGSKPEKKEQQLVSYYCLRSQNSTTKTYLDIVKKRVLDEVRDKRVDSSEHIEMPTSCIKQ